MHGQRVFVWSAKRVGKVGGGGGRLAKLWERTESLGELGEGVGWRGCWTSSGLGSESTESSEVDLPCSAASVDPKGTHQRVCDGCGGVVVCELCGVRDLYLLAAKQTAKAELCKPDLSRACARVTPGRGKIKARTSH